MADTKVNESPDMKAQSFVSEFRQRFPGQTPTAYDLMTVCMLATFTVDERFHKRLMALEARLAELEANKGIAYRGVHLDGDCYEPGDYTTRQGSLWCALEPTCSRPGTDGTWQLAVKRGRSR